jgi:hypothetical protein
VTVADATVEALRRAFTQVKNAAGPVLISFPPPCAGDQRPLD